MRCGREPASTHAGSRRDRGRYTFSATTSARSGTSARVLEEAASESAGQCGPCMFGVPAAAEDFGLLAAGGLDRAGFQRLRERLGLLPGRGACRFPDGVAGYARSALRVFGTEVDAHLAGRCTMLASVWRTDVVAV